MKEYLLKDYLTIYNFMDKNEVIFSYKGPISQEILIAVGDTIKTKLPTEDIGYKIIKRIFAVFIEEAQNVLKYSYDKHYDENKKATGIGLIGVGKRDEEYFFVFSVNVIKKEVQEKLKKHLDYINSLDEEKLKDFYNEKRKSGTLSEAGSAGLGFIDMARKSGKPLEYGFKELDKERSFFEVIIKIPYKLEETK